MSRLSPVQMVRSAKLVMFSMCSGATGIPLLKTLYGRSPSWTKACHLYDAILGLMATKLGGPGKSSKKCGKVLELRVAGVLAAWRAGRIIRPVRALMDRLIGETYA